MGYVILQVQIPYMPRYDEKQVALVVKDNSSFIKRCQVILGTLTINWAIRTMKESDMENVPKAWQSARHMCNVVSFKPSAVKKSESNILINE